MEQIDFSFNNITKEYLTNKKDYIIREITKVYNDVIISTNKRTYANTIQPLIIIDNYSSALINCFKYIYYYVQIAHDIKNHAKSIYINLEQFVTKNSMRKDIYIIVMDYNKHAFTKENKHLHFDEIYYFTCYLENFKRLGLHTSNKLVEKFKVDLIQAESELNHNIGSCCIFLNFTKQELSGVPLSWFESHQFSKVNNTEIFKVTLDSFNFNILMEYCADRSVRQKIHAAYNSKCNDENISLFTKIISLRSQLAKSLGYSNYADYVAETQVVETSSNAIKFQSELNKLITPLYEKEHSELLKFAIDYGFNDMELSAWDYKFYIRMFKETKCNIDMQKITTYFPINTIIEKMLNIYENLLGVIFVKVQNSNLWNKSVEYYKITNRISHNTVGYFLLDLYSRKGKCDISGIHPFQYGFETYKSSYYKNERAIPILCLVCNFPKGSLLSYANVETLFYKFGHMMHIIMNKTRLPFMSSFNENEYIVEDANQLTKYWNLSNYILKSLSSHEKTHEQIPDSIIKKIKIMNNVLKGYYNKNQLLYESVELGYHTLYLEDHMDIDMVQIYNCVHKNVMGDEINSDICIMDSWKRLMRFYSIVYYGYLRSTYSSNMYYRLFNKYELSKHKPRNYNTPRYNIVSR